ncbi:MAG TPA: DUF1499 domain-containing protein [Rhizomicrobium sp.]|nr:DUF1499 domain-containing protein [Rhizomicrobium sp.]
MRVLGVAARVSCALFVAALLIGIAATFGTRLGLWDYRVGLFELFPWCLYIGIAAFGFGLIWALGAFFSDAGEDARYGVIGLAGSIILIAMPLYDVAQLRVEPPIHDISTDTEHPPEFVALLGQRPGAEHDADYDGPKKALFDGKVSTVAALQHKYYEDIHADGEITSPEKLFKRAVKAAYAMGWTIVAVAPDEGRLEATDTSFFFGFTDDIVIRVKPAGMGARLDIRSKSRVGDGDMGRNAARIKAYLKRLAAT